MQRNKELKHPVTFDHQYSIDLPEDALNKKRMNAEVWIQEPNFLGAPSYLNRVYVTKFLWTSEQRFP